MSRTSKKELAARGEAARLQDKHRQWMEAEIAKLEKQGCSTEQILDELNLFEARLSPAMEILLDQIKDATVDNIDDGIRRAAIDLLRGEIPLDAFARQAIAD
jgi:hypothetical protein